MIVWSQHYSPGKYQKTKNAETPSEFFFMIVIGIFILLSRESDEALYEPA